MPTGFLNSFSPSTSSSSGLSETLFTRTKRKPAWSALAVLLGRVSRRSCSFGNPIHTEKSLFVRDFLNPYTHGRSANPLSLHSLPSASTSPKPMSSSSQLLFPKSAFPCMAGNRNRTAKGKNCENATKKGFACLP
jgi:hypothetical protein